MDSLACISKSEYGFKPRSLVDCWPADVNEARSVQGRGRGHKVEAEAKRYEAAAECYKAEAEARVD